MDRRFAFCPNCRRYVWVRIDRKTGQSLCIDCGEEIPEIENVSTPQSCNSTIMQDYISYPELNKTGGLS